MGKQQQLYKKQKEANAKAKANAGKTFMTPEARAAIEKAKQAHKCAICMQTFMVTAKAKELRLHCDAKHPKEDPVKCFPELPEMEGTVASASVEDGAEDWDQSWEAEDGAAEDGAAAASG